MNRTEPTPQKENNTRSIPMNFVKAVVHLRAAAEQGHSEACAKPAECYQ